MADYIDRCKQCVFYSENNGYGSGKPLPQRCAETLRYEEKCEYFRSRNVQIESARQRAVNVSTSSIDDCVQDETQILTKE